MAKPKITPGTTAIICQALRLGATYASAAEVAGIAESTFYNWIRRGTELKEGDKKVTRNNRLYLEFLEEIKRVEAEAEMSMLSRINQSGNNDWKALAWILERRHPNRWANTQRIEVQVERRVEDELNQMFDMLRASLPTDTYTDVVNTIANIQDRTAAAANN